MKVYISLLFIWFSLQSLFAQKTTFPAGVYFSFEELQKKAPSHQAEFRVNKRDSITLSKKGGNDFEVTPLNNAISADVYKDNVMAVSTGDSLFLNGQKMNITSSYMYVPLEGKYFAFKGAFSTGTHRGEDAAADAASAISVVALLTGATNMAVIPGFGRDQHVNRKRIWYILDVDSGQVCVLNKKFVLYALKNYPALNVQFEKTENNGMDDVLLKYISLIDAAEAENEKQKQ